MRRLIYASVGIFFGILFYVVLNVVRSNSKSVSLPVYGVAPEFSLTAHTGEVVSKSNFLGSVWVVDFFFTRCAGICPILTGQLVKVQNEFKDEPDFKMVSITVDPDYDNVKVLSSYAKAWGAIGGKWFFLTGSKEEIYKIAMEGFKLPVGKGSGATNFIHSDKIVLIDRAGRIRGYYSGTDEVEVKRLISDIKLVLGR